MAKRTKSESKGTVTVDSPIHRFDRVRRKFIMEHIRGIDYEDMARLIDVSPEELREAVEQMGIKLPIERAHKWKDIDLDKHPGIERCARCQVQINHCAFRVGSATCRECFEENIKLWIERGEKITVRFPNE